MSRFLGHAISGPCTMRWMRGVAAGAACLVAAAVDASAQQDTSRTRQPATTTVASSGDVAVSGYNVPAGDTAITRLERFVTQYPQSTLRPRALLQLGELLVRRADERFAASQRSGASSDTTSRPDYNEAIARYDELLSSYPTFDRRDAVAYTLGTLYMQQQRHADAVRAFESVANDSSQFRSEALFRLGDAYFEIAAAERGEARRAGFARAAAAYERATTTAPRDGDIYFLSLYKLGWSYYNQATQTGQAEYTKAVDVFGRLIDAYDKLSPEQQARLGLRGEALEYMAVAFTQVGGAEAANRYFAAHNTAYRLPVMRRVAYSLQEQGDFTRAVDAYQALIKQAPTDSTAVLAQREIIDIYQNRMLEPERAQQARLDLVTRFGPGSSWAQANAANTVALDSAAVIREATLREAAQYALAQAQQGSDRKRYSDAAALYERYLREFSKSDSAQSANALLAEALFNTGDYVRAGTEYSRTAYTYPRDSTGAFAERAGRNAIVAFDSARAKNPRDVAAQDSLFSTIDRFVARFPNSEVARTALMQKGRRASEAQRWDVMAETFRTYAQRYPSDPFTPNAQKLVGDALYRSGKYAEAQTQWVLAQNAARQGGRSALADSIGGVRSEAAMAFADTLIRAGNYERAAEGVYVAYADSNAGSDKAADALRNAVETYMLAQTAARERGDSAASQKARDRAIVLSERLTKQYPRYQYRAQYQSLRARLLAESGKREEATVALQAAITENPSWSGRADAMVQLALSLDSLGRKREAAAAYDAFATSYPKDRRAADAQYNAAVTYLEVPDTVAAARAYGLFASRFPSDPRTPQARSTRLAMLRATGDSASAQRELASLCTTNANVSADLRATCAARLGEQEFRTGAAIFPRYQAVKLVIPSKAQLTAAGVRRASKTKQDLLREMSDHFTKAIESGAPVPLAAATFYVGLAQWEYGNFLKNVRLPGGLTEAERTSAMQGSERQAAEYFAAAEKTWQALLDKAAREKIDNEWVTRARDAVAGNVPATPPSPDGGAPAASPAGGRP